MDNKIIHDLDQGIEEYFDFKIFGKEYRFRQLNTDEFKQLSILLMADETGEKIQEYLFKFIAPIEVGGDDFSVVYKKMTLPHVKRFNQMIRQEFGLELDK